MVQNGILHSFPSLEDPFYPDASQAEVNGHRDTAEQTLFSEGCATLEIMIRSVKNPNSLPQRSAAS